MTDHKCAWGPRPLAGAALLSLLLFLPTVSVAQEQPTGESLPPGAIRRLGSVRRWPREADWVVALSPDTKLFASGNADNTISIWGADPPEPDSRFTPERYSGHELLLLDGHEGDVRCIAFSPDGKVLASAGDDRTLRLWSTATGDRLPGVKDLATTVRCLAWSADGKILSAGGDDRVQI